jgi:hypothetical protein
MTNQLDLFIKSQPSDLQALENMVSYTDTSTVDLLDWDIRIAQESGDTQRVHELITIKHDMN